MADFPHLFYFSFSITTLALTRSLPLLLFCVIVTCTVANQPCEEYHELALESLFALSEPFLVSLSITLALHPQILT